MQLAVPTISSTEQNLIRSLSLTTAFAEDGKRNSQPPTQAGSPLNCN
jgi:hypothetical protein